LELQAKSVSNIITRLSFHLSKTGKCRFKVAFVGLFVRPYEKVVRLGFSKPHLVISLILTVVSNPLMANRLEQLVASGC
jgi:hypothetical protein